MSWRGIDGPSFFFSIKVLTWNVSRETSSPNPFLESGIYPFNHFICLASAMHTNDTST